MNTFRRPQWTDHKWMTEAYADWPKGMVDSHDVKLFLERWIDRGSPVCDVLEEDGVPVGLVTYRTEFMVCWVYNIVVHPDARRKGHSKTLRQRVRDVVEPQGVVVGGFKALPGTPFEGLYDNDTVAIGDPL